MTTEQALKASKGAVLPDTLAQQTGISVHQTTIDLSMLTLSGKAEEVGGRYRWVAQATKIKGATVRKAGTVRSAQASSGPGTVTIKGVYPIQIVTTRWKDRRTGKFVRQPADGVPLKLKVRRASTTKDEGLQVVRQYRQDTASGERVPVKYSVRFPEARAAYRRGELGKAELDALERDIADGLLSAEGQKIMARAEAAHHAQEMGAAYRSDKAKRGAATRARKRASGIAPKRRKGEVIRRDWLKVQADLEATRKAHLKARTPNSAANHKKRERTLLTRRDKLRQEAKQAGVQL